MSQITQCLEVDTIFKEKKTSCFRPAIRYKRRKIRKIKKEKKISRFQPAIKYKKRQRTKKEKISHFHASNYQAALSTRPDTSLLVQQANTLVIIIFIEKTTTFQVQIHNTHCCLFKKYGLGVFVEGQCNICKHPSYGNIWIELKILYC